MYVVLNLICNITFFFVVLVSTAKCKGKPFSFAHSYGGDEDSR